jgi:hypothetical protein
MAIRDFFSSRSVPKELRGDAKEINEEGYDGQAAVLIGKKGRDLKRKYDSLQEEGRTTDLETYMGLSEPDLSLTSDVVRKLIPPELFEKFEQTKIGGAQLTPEGDKFVLCYKNRDGSFVKVVIDPRKIKRYNLIISERGVLAWNGHRDPGSITSAISQDLRELEIDDRDVQASLVLPSVDFEISKKAI